MENPLPRVGSVVVLYWQDSSSLHGWQYDNPSLSCGSIKSAGVVVACTPQELTISTAVNEEGSYICPIAIPWRSVTFFREVKFEN